MFTKGALLFLHGGVQWFVNELTDKEWVTQDLNRSPEYSRPSLASARLEGLPVSIRSEIHGFQI